MFKAISNFFAGVFAAVVMSVTSTFSIMVGKPALVLAAPVVCTLMSAATMLSTGTFCLLTLIGTFFSVWSMVVGTILAATFAISLAVIGAAAAYIA